MTKAKQSLSPEQEKATYRVTNWSAYDAALVKRGQVTLWFAELLGLSGSGIESTDSFWQRWRGQSVFGAGDPDAADVEGGV